MRQFMVCAMTLVLLSLAAWAAQDGAAPERDAGERDRLLPSSAEVLLGAVFPRISPDGRSLAYSYQGAIWRVPREGGTMVRLTSESGFDLEPAWSPDGSLIAYVHSETFGAGALRVLDSETGLPVPLKQHIEVLGTNVFQKIEFLTETKILGVFRTPGQPLALGWVDFRSGESKQIFPIPRWGRFALSHDLKQIAYTSTLDAPGQQNGNDGCENGLYTISVDGGTSVEVLRFPSRIYDLCWAADDSGFYLVSDHGAAHNDLWHVPLVEPERGMQRVTLGQADEDRPSISGDGKWLAYSDNQHSATALRIRDLRTGTEREIVVERLDYRKPVGKIRLTTREKQTGRPVTCRMSIQQVDGKMSAPPSALYRILGNVPHFYHSDTSAWDLPAGRYLVRATCGPEFKMSRAQIEVREGEVTECNVDLERWTNAAAKGWYSGENHIHANYGYGQWYNTPRTMLQQCTGEDLNVCNFMVANSDTDAVFDREFFRGRVDPLSTQDNLLYWNQEFRSTIWGHMTLLGLKQVVEPVFTGFRGTTNPWDIPTNAQIADRAHWQKGLVNYTHVAQNPADPYENPYTGKGLPIDVALGKIDTLDLNASYIGTVPLWYRLLNCGFRLPASAGTDTFLNRIASRVPGGDRVYVKLKGPLRYEDWIEGLRAGRSFVSNGPLLEFSAENSFPGDTISLLSPRTVRIQGTATSQFPMDKVEVVYNGKIIATAELSADRTSAVLDQGIPLDRSGWLSFRASGVGHPDHPVGTLDAHCSPIYVRVAKHPVGSREDAEYFLKWIERLSLALKVRDRIPDPALRQQVETQFEASRTVYQKVIEASQTSPVP